MAVTSVFEAIELAFVDALKTVSGIADGPDGEKAVTVVPLDEAFESFGPGDEDVRPAVLPVAYPGCVVSLAERAITVVESNPGPTSGYRIYKVPVWVSTYATSPSGGTVANDAKYKCWEVVQAIQFVMITTAPSFADVRPIWPVEAEEMMNIPTDANTYGVMQVFSVKFQLHASKV